jgi:hypothetical protein
MPTTDKMKLKARAHTLGIEGFRTMSETDLATAIANAEGTQAGTKPTRPVATKGANGNGNGKAAPVKGAVKGAPTKGAVKTAPQPAAPAKGTAAKVSAPAVKGTGKTTTSPAIESKTQKSAPAKGAAAKGEAKRTGATAKTTTATKSKQAAVKGAASTTAKRTAAKGNAAPAKASTAAPKADASDVKRAPLDVSAIDWSAESEVGKTGKRAVVLTHLRKHAKKIHEAGALYAAVFEDIKSDAAKWYPNAQNKYPHLSKRAAAEKDVRWLIGRVAYDFAYKTGQHSRGSRVWTTPTKTAAPKGRAMAAKGAPQKGAKTKTATAVKGAAKKPAAKAAASRSTSQKATPARKSAARGTTALKTKG